MSEVNWISIRIFFSKTGRAKYISHLDTMRTLTRAFKRSGLPFWYTQGFNPHLYMTFALPLALGTESRSESLDARFTEPVDFEQAAQRLNEALPPGFEVQRIAEPQMDPNSIVWAEYEIELRSDRVPALRAAMDTFWQRESIEVVKKTKKVTKTIDIRPLMQLQRCEERDDALLLRVCLRAGNALNIAPRLLLDAFVEHSGLQPEAVRILRVRVSDENNRDFL